MSEDAHATRQLHLSMMVWSVPNVQQMLLQFINVEYLRLIQDSLLDDALCLQELNSATQFPVFIRKFAYQFPQSIAFYEIQTLNESFIFVAKHNFTITTWGASANTLRSSALALCYSAAEYTAPQSGHALLTQVGSMYS